MIARRICFSVQTGCGNQTLRISVLQLRVIGSVKIPVMYREPSRVSSVRETDDAVNAYQITNNAPETAGNVFGWACILDGWAD